MSCNDKEVKQEDANIKTLVIPSLHLYFFYIYAAVLLFVDTGIQFEIK